MTIRTRKTAAGYAVSWRYRGHKYQAVAVSVDRAKAMRQAIRAKKLPKVVVAIGYGQAISAHVDPSAAKSAYNGSAGGRARAEALSGPERSAIASKASLARWTAHRAKEATNGAD